MSRHTPGPWYVLPDESQIDDYRVNIACLNGEVGCAYTKDSIDVSPEETANAHLIAAAPELLGAAKAALRWFEQVPIAELEEAEDAIEENAPFRELSKAIAMAEGR